ARASSLAERREECARVWPPPNPDPEARRRRTHDGRFLRTLTDADGAWNLAVRDNPEVGATIMAALGPRRDRLFAEARAEGRREPGRPTGRRPGCVGRPEPGIATTGGRAGGGCAGGRSGQAGSPSGGVAGAGGGERVDLGALLRGRPVGDEVAEIAGFGPVAVSAIADMIDTGDPFLAAVVTNAEAVVGVAHLGRRPRAVQRSALEWLHPTCAVESCTTVAGLQYDHRVDWARTHLTIFDLLDRLCGHHHHLKTTKGWALVEGRGRRAFVAPGDPRHPGRQPPARPPPPPRAGDEGSAAAVAIAGSRGGRWRRWSAFGPRLPSGRRAPRLRGRPGRPGPPLPVRRAGGPDRHGRRGPGQPAVNTT
ncbi:MAG: hypothetical protein ACRD1K_11525, partial [Acidimicrobiales bacterium]